MELLSVNQMMPLFTRDYYKYWPKEKKTDLYIDFDCRNIDNLLNINDENSTNMVMSPGKIFLRRYLMFPKCYKKHFSFV